MRVCFASGRRVVRSSFLPLPLHSSECHRPPNDPPPTTSARVARPTHTLTHLVNMAQKRIAKVRATHTHTADWQRAAIASEETRSSTTGHARLNSNDDTQRNTNDKHTARSKATNVDRMGSDDNGDYLRVITFHDDDNGGRQHRNASRKRQMLHCFLLRVHSRTSAPASAGIFRTVV